MSSTQRGFQIASIQSIPLEQIDYADLIQQMKLDKRLTVITEKEFETSYLEGQSVLLITEQNVAVGHIRIRPLLDSKLIQALGITPCAELWEFCSSYLSAAYRGNYTLLRYEILRTCLDHFRQNRLCTLGITEIASSITSMHHNAFSFHSDYGVHIQYFAYDAKDDLTFEMLNPLIMTNDPLLKVQFASGLSYAAALRSFDSTSPEIIDQANRYFQDFDTQEHFAKQSRSMFSKTSVLSDRKLAMQICQALRDQFESPEHLLRKLMLT